MKKELLDFYEEMFHMGDFLWKMFSRRHPYHQLISFIADNRFTREGNNRVPSLAYTCAKVEISLDALETQLGHMKERIENYFYQNGEFEHSIHPYLDLPFAGTVFFFNQEEGESSCLLKVKMKLDFELGVPIQSLLFPGKYKGRHFQITARLVRMTYEGIVYAYYLKPVRDK